MATRGQIAYLADPNTIFSIYVHYDAYPEGVGKALTTHFNSDEQADNLVMDGNDIRFIDDDGTVERFDRGGAKPIRSEEPEELFSELYSYADSASADYVYVWLEDKWVALKMGKGRQYFVGTLLDQMRKIEPTMENKNKIKEGYYGNTNVESHIQALGYDSFEDFFNDNPGGEDALMSWIESIPAFKKTLVDQGLLEAKKELEELDEAFVHQMKYKAGIIK